MVSCGDTHSVALTEGGTVFTFGRNQNGQLGIGTDSDVLKPARVTALQASPAWVPGVRSWPCGASCAAT